MIKLFEQGDLVFDVGANIGAKAELFLAQGARVVCFEPQPRCIESLRSRFSERGEVVIVEEGLAAQVTRMRLSVCSEADTISTFAKEWQSGRFSTFRWDHEITVGVTTLDRMIELYGVPAYCKIDVEGFELQVLQGLSRPVPHLSFEFAIEFFANARACIAYLLDLGYTGFNFAVGEATEFALPAWTSAADVQSAIEEGHERDPLLWGDIYARLDPASPKIERTSLDALRAVGLCAPGSPVRLHLGCGEQHLSGYVNIDYPADSHALMKVRPDFEADLLSLSFPAESVDEIRLHHVFEHFNRVTALALLLRWQRWLKIGGKLRIETPDLEGSARTLLSDAPFSVRMGAARHLAGDQAAPWAYHLDLWFPERFKRTLLRLGFCEVITTTSSWPHPPYLANVEVVARKQERVWPAEQLVRADELLWDSLVARVEQPTWETWRTQLREVFRSSNSRLASAQKQRVVPVLTGLVFSKDRPLQLEATLRSFLVHCQDREEVNLKVLYLASSPDLSWHYRDLMTEYPSVEFIAEHDFKQDVDGALANVAQCLLLVDDNLFVRPFCLKGMIAALERDDQAIGFSLRLGRNITYCYPLDKVQALPSFEEVDGGALRYDWTAAHDAFAYPLEVSSSIYKMALLKPLLTELAYTNPNTLEAKLAEIAAVPRGLPRYLLCPPISVTFSAPLNVVQRVFENRASAKPEYAAPLLAEAFAQGLRIDVGALAGFTPSACHEEIELRLRPARPDRQGASDQNELQQFTCLGKPQR